MAGRTSINFHQLCVPSGDLPLVNFLCGRENFRQLLATFCAARRPSVNIHQLLCAARRHFVSFRQHYVRLGDLPSTSFNFPCRWETFRHLPSTICGPWRTFVNFRQLSLPPCDLSSTAINLLCGRKIFRQLPSSSVLPGVLPSSFVRSGNLLSTFVCISYGRKTVRQILSTFRAAVRLSVNFH